MIKYKLNCQNCNLSFDSWFASSKEYEKLKKKKYLSCHHCGSKKVKKTLMAPKLINNSNSDTSNQYIFKPNQIDKKLENIKFIKKNFKYVGKILLMKLDLYIIIIKKKKKVFMGLHQIKK